jgi:hypothetical protein
MVADEANIQASLCAAIRIAKEQKSVSLEKRAEATSLVTCLQRPDFFNDLNCPVVRLRFVDSFL